MSFPPPKSERVASSTIYVFYCLRDPHSKLVWIGWVGYETMKFFHYIQSMLFFDSGRILSN